MFIKVNEELVLILFPKSGSSSIQKALRVGWSEISPNIAVQYERRIAFMREPHERAESAYNMFVAEGSSQHDISSFDKFILDICKGHKDDPHVMSQSEQCYYDKHDAGIFLPTQVIRWDFAQLEAVLALSYKDINFTIPLVNEGVGKRPVWSEGSRKKFDKVYKKDIAIWEGLREPYHKYIRRRLDEANQE